MVINPIVFLENEQQAVDFLLNHKNKFPNATIIALSPFAAYELEKRNISYKTPEDYCNQKELYALGIKNYEKVETLCKLLDSHILKHNSFVRKYDLTPAFYNFYSIKMLYDGITIRLYQLFEIIKKESPELVFYYKNKEKSIRVQNTSEPLLPDNKESIYVDLLGFLSNKIELIPLPTPQLEMKSASNSTLYKTLKSKIKNLLISNSFISKLLFKFKKLKFISKKSSENAPILLFGGGYNWNSCLSFFSSYGLGPVLSLKDDSRYWYGHIPATYNSIQLLEEIKKDKNLREFFIHSGIDFFPLLEEQLKFIINESTWSCIRAYEYTESLSKNYGIKLILSSTFTSSTSKAIAKAAHKNNLPVFLWQHGNYGYHYSPMSIYQNIIYPDVFFTFGDGVTKKYKEEGEKYHTELVSIGSGALDTLFSRIKEKKDLHNKLNLDPNKKIILYASTNFYRNHLYVTFSPFFSDINFWKTQKKILNVLLTHSDYNVIIKLHGNLNYGESPIKNYVNENKFSNCAFFSGERDLADLIPFADILIIDFPSTTLLQSLTTSKSIFTTTEHLEIDDGAKKLLKKRAYCFDKTDELVNNLKIYLEKGPATLPTVDLNNREFLKMYGTHLDDGKSAERAVEFLNKTIHGSSKKRE